MTTRPRFSWTHSVANLAPFGFSLSLHAGIILALSVPTQQALYVRTGVPEIRITLHKSKSNQPAAEVRQHRPKEKKQERPIVEEKIVETVAIGVEGPIARDSADSAPFIDDISPRFSPTPRYPRQARQRGQEGFVRLKIAVSGLGIPVVVELLESSGYELLDREAVRTLKLWRFNPTHKKEEISYWTEKTVQFRLDQ